MARSAAICLPIAARTSRVFEGVEQPVDPHQVAVGERRRHGRRSAPSTPTARSARDTPSPMRSSIDSMRTGRDIGSDDRPDVEVVEARLRVVRLGGGDRFRRVRHPFGPRSGGRRASRSSPIVSFRPSASRCGVERRECRLRRCRCHRNVRWRGSRGSRAPWGVPDSSTRERRAFTRSARSPPAARIATTGTASAVNVASRFAVQRWASASSVVELDDDRTGCQSRPADRSRTACRPRARATGAPAKSVRTLGPPLKIVERRFVVQVRPTSSQLRGSVEHACRTARRRGRRVAPCRALAGRSRVVSATIAARSRPSGVGMLGECERNRVVQASPASSLVESLRPRRRWLCGLAARNDGREPRLVVHAETMLNAATGLRLPAARPRPPDRSRSGRARVRSAARCRELGSIRLEPRSRRGPARRVASAAASTSVSATATNFVGLDLRFELRERRAPKRSSSRPPIRLRSASASSTRSSASHCLEAGRVRWLPGLELRLGLGEVAVAGTPMRTLDRVRGLELSPRPCCLVRASRSAVHVRPGRGEPFGRGAGRLDRLFDLGAVAGRVGSHRGFAARAAFGPLASVRRIIPYANVFRRFGSGEDPGREGHGQAGDHRRAGVDAARLGHVQSWSRSGRSRR